jgi:hypothetical protein
MRPLKVISFIFGILFALAGAAAVTSAGFVFGVNRLQSSPNGFFETSSQAVGSNGFALTVPNINGQLTGDWERWGLSRSQATVRVTGSSRLPTPLFIGIGPTAQVSKYLAGVARDRVTSLDLDGGSVQYEHVDGTAMPNAPSEQTFWTAKTSGTGSQTLEWTMREGDWAMVVMNADASAPVVADMRLGARFGIVNTLIGGLAGVGVVLLAIAATLFVLARSGRRY